MVDIPRLSGTGGSSEPAGGKGVPRTDAEKFKELMKVSDADADQKKKKKQQQEALEEKKAASRTESVPLPQEKEKAAELHKFKKSQKIEKPGESEKRQKQQQKRPEETPPEMGRRMSEEQKKVEKTPTVRETQRAATTEKSHTAPAKVEKPVGSKIPTHLPATSPKPSKQMLDVPPPPPLPIPLAHFAEEKEEKISSKAIQKESVKPSISPEEKKKNETTQIPEGAAFPQGGAPGPFFIPAAAATAPAYTQMSPEMFALFERMMSALIIMQDSGITETVIHLASSEFTLFAGAQLVIREFSTAPKAFNIEFQGNAQNIALFNSSINDLMAAFQHGNYNFKINRMDSSLLQEERPEFHRKESAGDKDDGKKQKGQK